MEMDALDKLAAESLPGYIVRKDLVNQFKGQYPVPTYVVEFLLGRYCATTDPEEIREGLDVVSRQLSRRAVRSGEEELFKSRAREEGSIKILDIIKARLDARTDSYVAELPSLQIKDARIGSDLVTEHDRMLTGGFYAEVNLSYDAQIAQEANGRPFGVESLREIQLSKRNVLDALCAARQRFSTEEWKDLLIRSVGLEPASMSDRAQDMTLVRMIPFVENNFNLVELGPRGTGKSHLYQQISPYSHLVSGGKTTVARMFVHLGTGQRGLVCQYDVVCFDEIAGISFDKKDGVNIMKGYMESGEFSRGKESIRGYAGLVMVGNFDVDVQHQQRIGHLLTPLPDDIQNDTAFMDRLHGYVPGWEMPKINPSKHLTEHFGLVSDFLSECWTRLRSQTRVAALNDRVILGGALSGRDRNATKKTASGLLKLLYPDREMKIKDEDLEWAVRLGLECRRRVKEQQKRVVRSEFRDTSFSYQIGNEGVEQFVVTPELQSEDSIGTDPLPAGQVWTISPGGTEEDPGLYRIEVSTGPGSGVKILNRPVPQAFRESVSYAEQNLYSRAPQLVGDKDPRGHEFSVQLRAFDSAREGRGVGVSVLLALCGALLEKSLKGGLIVVGQVNLGGSIDPLYNALGVAELAIEKGASSLLIPVSARKQLFDLPDDMATKVGIQYYKDPADALVKALGG